MRSNSLIGNYAYPAARHRPTTVAGQTFTYDANGNNTAGLNGRTVGYDGEHRPIWVVYQGKRTEYTYGADGGRLLMRENVGTAQETLTATFGEVEVRNFGQGTAEVIITYPLPDIRLINGAPSWLHRDQLNSVRAISNPAGARARQTVYRPFGQAIDYTNDATKTAEASATCGVNVGTDGWRNGVHPAVPPLHSCLPPPPALRDAR